MKKNFLFIIAIISLSAFCIRLGISVELSFKDSFVLSPPRVTDMATYKNLALSVLKGTFDGHFYYQPFYYAVFLPVVLFLFGGSLWGIYVVQSMLGALTVYIASIACAKVFGKRAGILTALLLCFSSALIAYIPYMLIATLQAFWVALIFYLALLALKKENVFYWALTGFVVGCAILTRGNIWFFVPGLLGFALFRNLKLSSKNAIRAFLLMLFIILPQLPFVWHNTDRLGKISAPSSAADNVLALGNTPESPPGGRTPGDIFPGPMEYTRSFDLWTHQGNGGTVPGKIFEWFVKEPFAFMELMFRKGLLFWDYREIPNNIAVEYNCSKSVLFRWLSFVQAGLLIVFALAGMVLLSGKIRKDQKTGLLFYLIISYWMATAAFYILGRFRAPVMPLLGIYAGGFLSWTFFMIKQKSRKKIYTRVLGGLIFGIFVCVSSYELYRRNLEAPVMSFVRPEGVEVDVSSVEKIFFDNGPSTCGGWIPETLKPLVVMTKKFSIPQNEDFTSARFALKIVWRQPGNAVFKVNGEIFDVFSKCISVKYQDFEIPFPKDGTVSLEVMKNSGETYIFMDFQRNYGRTFINGKPVPAELVCTLTCYKKQN